MAKLISRAARETLTERFAGAKLIGLIRITPVGGGPDDVVRLCTDATMRLGVDPLRYGTISRGDLYDAMGIRLLTPGSSKDELPSTSLEMDNIDPSLIRAIQMSPFRAALDLEVVLSSAPDEVVESWPAMEITEASFDDDVVTLSVGYASQAEEPAMMHRMTVNVFPATRAAA